MSDTVEVSVGSIGRAHGIRGDVTIDVTTDEPERRFAVGAVLRIEDTRRTVTVASSRWHSGRLLVHLEGVDDRTAAEQLRGLVLVVDVPADEAPEDPEEFYDRQLVGLTVRTQDGTEVGTVTDVLHGAGQDLLAIETDTGEHLVPFVVALVPHVDVTAGHLTLADVPGLLTDEDA